MFYLNVPFGFCCMAVIALAYPPSRSDKPVQVDWLGASLLFAGVSALLIALGGETGNAGWWLGGAIVLLVAFGWVERRAPEPILPVDLLRLPIMTRTLVVVFLVGLALFGAIAFIPLFVQSVMGGTATQSSRLSSRGRRSKCIRLAPSSVSGTSTKNKRWSVSGSRIMHSSSPGSLGSSGMSTYLSTTFHHSDSRYASWQSIVVCEMNEATRSQLRRWCTPVATSWSGTRSVRQSPHRVGGDGCVRSGQRLRRSADGLQSASSHWR